MSEWPKALPDSYTYRTVHPDDPSFAHETEVIPADLGREQNEALEIAYEWLVGEWGAERIPLEVSDALARYDREVAPRMARDEMDEKRERDQRESDRRTEDEMRRQERVDER